MTGGATSIPPKHPGSTADHRAAPGEGVSNPLEWPVLKQALTRQPEILLARVQGELRWLIETRPAPFTRGARRR